MQAISDKEAALKLDFIVVGGGECPSCHSCPRYSHVFPGLAGFGVAFALSKAGHRVRVFERHTELGHTAGGLRIPPNMSKILKSWAGEEALMKFAVLNVGTPWYDSE